MYILSCNHHGFLEVNWESRGQWPTLNEGKSIGTNQPIFQTCAHWMLPRTSPIYSPKRGDSQQKDHFDIINYWGKSYWKTCTCKLFLCARVCACTHTHTSIDHAHPMMTKGCIQSNWLLCTQHTNYKDKMWSSKLYNYTIRLGYYSDDLADSFYGFTISPSLHYPKLSQDPNAKGKAMSLQWQTVLHMSIEG